VPGEKATDIGVVLYAIPGALLGMALVYLEGIRRRTRRQARVAPRPERRAGRGGSVSPGPYAAARARAAL